MGVTPLDLAQLRALKPIEAGIYLTGQSTAQLRAFAFLVSARVKRRAEKADLIDAILKATHPAPSPDRGGATYEQQRFA